MMEEGLAQDPVPIPSFAFLHHDLSPVALKGGGAHFAFGGRRVFLTGGRRVNLGPTSAPAVCSAAYVFAMSVAGSAAAGCRRSMQRCTRRVVSLSISSWWVSVRSIMERGIELGSGVVRKCTNWRARQVMGEAAPWPIQ